MSPEMMIALVSAGSGLALVVGGWMLGSKGGGDVSAEAGDVPELRFKLDQAIAASGELRKKMESERAGLEMKITAAKLERDRFSTELEQALKDKPQQPAIPGDSVLEAVRQTLAVTQKERDDLRARCNDIEEKLRKSHPSMASIEPDKDIKKAREEIDRLRTELSKQDSRISGMQGNVEKSAAQIEALTKERDESRERQEAADRIIEGVRARSTGLQQQLKDAQAEIARLKGG
jgi:chromosome segregation ATPase